MGKKVPLPVRSFVCQECHEVSWLIVGGKLDGFIRHGCIHTVKMLLMELLKDKIKARAKLKKAAKKKATARKRGA